MTTEEDAETDAPASHAATSRPLVVREISKSYGPVKALQAATLELATGELHALVGENGSGKSTLVGVISGTVRPDSGGVEIGGHTCTRHTPWESQRNGALTVFQDGSVLPELTVAQNLYLGTPSAQRPAYRKIGEWATARLQEYELGGLEVHARAASLSAGDRQLLEIARALMARPAVLLLDEATSALDAAGVDVALDLMRKAAGAGCAVLFVTHRLSEVLRVAERISVLRDGMWQGTYDAQSMDVRRLVELMAGTSVDLEFPQRARPEAIGDVVLSADRLAGERYGPVDLAVRGGEIVGLAGADDNGQLELLRGLAAIDLPDGNITVRGKAIANYGDAVRARAVLLSGDRRTESLFAPLAIRENLVIGVLDTLARLGVVSWSREKQAVEQSVHLFGIRLASAENTVGSLSGGNQQKVALARVLATKPDVLLIDEPTRGVDVRSRLDIYRMLRESAEQGLVVVLVSSDASELAGLCDRVLVVSRGSIVAELPGETASEEQIVQAFTGAEHGQCERERPSGEGGRLGTTAGRSPLNPLSLLARLPENAARLLLLLLVMFGVGAYAQSQNSSFLSTASIYNVLLLALPLAAVAGAQFVAIFTGGLDVSVGAAMGVTVALLSFVVTSGSLITCLLISIAVAIGFGVVVGTANATLIARIGISPVIATVAMLGILQGVGLELRPTAAGNISTTLTNALTDQVWIFPVPLLVVAALFVGADTVLRSSGYGLGLRAVGLNPHFAYRVGVNAPRLRRLSYVGCSILAGLAGVLLAGQVGVGDSTVGNQYTLLAIAAPVLGGASLLGGRGTFLGCLLGAVLLALVQTLPTTLGLSDAASYLLTGGLTLLALLIYTSGVTTKLRNYRRAVVHKISSGQRSNTVQSHRAGG